MNALQLCSGCSDAALPLVVSAALDHEASNLGAEVTLLGWSVTAVGSDREVVQLVYRFKGEPTIIRNGRGDETEVPYEGIRHSTVAILTDGTRLGGMSGLIAL